MLVEAAVVVPPVIDVNTIEPNEVNTPPELKATIPVDGVTIEKYCLKLLEH